ncbi:ubiquitin-conjugating enzyme E2-20 kDa [Sphaceloma murrayae]|uniref:Ubiquitin-conjugating enzyme E2-20 kDa n=1 Tax=Sphaceloma murrayae TaxID=2082308 RepID=A0A2K1QJU9_9PEZI|nr:ubiquitin-conjugating enzyme E2-20 kDa [Sphaceloma murrayae]
MAPTNPSSPQRTGAKDSGNIMKRLQSELMTLMTSAPPGCSAFPHNGDMLHWDATLLGPEGTPYAGLTLKLSFEFPARYPFVPPEVRFRTPIYHPNFDFKGRICLDILKDKWSAVLNVGTVLISLQSLLGEPNNSSPLNGQAAELWDSDMDEFKRQVLARHRDIVDGEDN